VALLQKEVGVGDHTMVAPRRPKKQLTTQRLLHRQGPPVSPKFHLMAVTFLVRRRYSFLGDGLQKKECIISCIIMKISSQKITYLSDFLDKLPWWWLRDVGCVMCLRMRGIVEFLFHADGPKKVKFSDHFVDWG
jgi:hypothetical protein